MTRDEARLIKYAEKIKSYCTGRDCVDCVFDNGDRCCLEEEHPVGWDLPEVKYKWDDFYVKS